MARKPARVDWIVHHRTQTKVALRLDRKTMQFEAEYGGRTFHSKDGAEVKAQVLDAIKAQCALEFHPVIEVALRHGYSSSSHHAEVQAASIILELARYYYAVDGEVMWILSWDNFESGNLERTKGWHPHTGRERFSLPFRREANWDDRLYAAYSEELWAGLQELQAVIEKARERVLELMMGDIGLESIRAMGARILRALPAGDEEAT